MPHQAIRLSHDESLTPARMKSTLNHPLTQRLDSVSLLSERLLSTRNDLTSVYPAHDPRPNAPVSRLMQRRVGTPQMHEVRLITNDGLTPSSRTVTSPLEM